MKTYFEASFERDLKKIKEKEVLRQIKEIIESVKKAHSFKDIQNLKKLKGYNTFYRIRFGDYRICIDVSGEEVIFVRCLGRKDIYKFFPVK